MKASRSESCLVFEDGIHVLITGMNDNHGSNPGRYLGFLVLDDLVRNCNLTGQWETSHVWCLGFKGHNGYEYCSWLGCYLSVYTTVLVAWVFSMM